VGALASQTIKKVQLELGGKSVAFALDDAQPADIVMHAVSGCMIHAGQGCGCTTRLLLPERMHDEVVGQLVETCRALPVGDPRDPATNVGPVIDAAAKGKLERWLARMEQQGRVRFRWDRHRPMPAAGTYVPPTIIMLDHARDLQEEVFGPILHVVRWQADALDGLIEDIAANGYALTVGVHSRIDTTVEEIAARLSHGNVYVNRNMIGAVVGTQPFGGTGLSGTGPKAGGPNYLRRFVTEQVVTINTAAAGGNASLLTAEE
jgi:RHH-type proline utilization regulon transcriptional repressor/proline dehydrogenase/delta 1-pyrroline-5-carboxylate dehydrogenase